MAPAVAETFETKAVVSRFSTLILQDVLSTAIRVERDYSISSTTNSSYYHSISTAFKTISSSLTTVVISRTETTTLTTTALVTSESTVALPDPTEAPFLLSTPENGVLSPGGIAGIVLGALVGLLLLVLLFYLFLTRTGWMPRVHDWRLEMREKKHTKGPKREPKEDLTKKIINSAKVPDHNTTNMRHASDGKQAQPKPVMNQRSASVLITPEQRQYELNEREKGHKTQSRHSKPVAGKAAKRSIYEMG